MLDEQARNEVLNPIKRDESHLTTWWTICVDVHACTFVCVCVTRCCDGTFLKFECLNMDFILHLSFLNEHNVSVIYFNKDLCLSLFTWYLSCPTFYFLCSQVDLNRAEECCYVYTDIFWRQNSFESWLSHLLSLWLN